MPDANFDRSCWCDACKWHGTVGQLIAGNKPGLRCPKCDSPQIAYPVSAGNDVKH